MARKPKSDPLPDQKSQDGFGESPQPALSGAPLSGSVSEWAQEISEAAETEDTVAKTVSEKTGEKTPPKKKAAAKKTSGAAKAKKPARTARGTSMGDSVDPREKAAGGLNPIAGLDISLEDAEELLEKQVKATKRPARRTRKPPEPAIPPRWRRYQR